MTERVVLREFSFRGEADIVRELRLVDGIGAFDPGRLRFGGSGPVVRPRC
jgi:hypothetical protein